MKKTLFIAALLITTTIALNAQGKKWSLEDCINYAITNNIGLQRQRLQTDVAQVNFTKSRMDVLPSLNAGSDGRIGFGRSVDPVTNLITFKQNISHSYYITSGINLFKGFATMNTIAANKFLLKSGLETEKVARNTLIVDILGQYYQVIYTKGLESASLMQLKLSENQLFRITKLVETGKEAESKQYELESKVSSDRLNYTIAQNTSDQALTTLRQILQLEPGTEFDIIVPDLANTLIKDETFRTDSIYTLASSTLPRLKAIEYELRATRKQLAASRGGISPSLTMGGQLFTGFYKVIGEDGQPAYSTQLKNNSSQAVFISLDIPIFNNFNTGRNIKLAKIRKDDASLRLELEKNKLYTEIENACLDYNRGKDEFAAAQSNYQFNMKSFSAVQKKFESGLIDVTDFSAAQTSLFRAETEALRTRLLLMIRKLTIQFYSTGEYSEMTL
jgi:outer membrane protein TolC